MKAVFMQGGGFYGATVYLVADELSWRLEEKLGHEGYRAQSLGEGVGRIWSPPEGGNDTYVLMLEVHDDQEVQSFQWDTGHSRPEWELAALLGLPPAGRQARCEAAAKREGLPVEQGARDSLQLAINALERARDSQKLHRFVDNLAAALLEVQDAMRVQKVRQLDFEGLHQDVLKPLLPGDE